jgi:hypothetical protein
VRLIKMLGFAAATALTAMALVGASAASADSACLVDPPGGALGTCPAGAVWNGPIIGLSQEAVFKVHNTVTTCKSEFLADYNANEGPHVGVLYLVLNLNFTQCVGACQQAFAEHLPYLLLASMANQHAILRPDFNGPPSVLLGNCLILGLVLNCLYNLPKPSSLLNYVLELNGQLFPLAGALRANLPLTWGGDDMLCPGAANFEATYLIYKDVGGQEGAELFFTALP